MTFIESGPPLRAFRPPAVALELNAPNDLVSFCLRGVIPCPELVLCCAVLAVFALPCRADQASSTSETLIRLTVATGARPQAGPPLPAPARI